MRINCQSATLLLFLLLSGFLPACQGQLSKEQRQEMQEAREQREIIRLTDQEIVQAALETGRLIRQELDKGNAADSLLKLYAAEVSMYRDSLDMAPLEAEIWEAYQAGWEMGQSLNDNVQRAYPDFLYYTYPVIENDSLKGMTSIRINRKELIVNQ